ncbi:MAG: response regulator transcription factor [Rivularia sp. (in: Bacteria)]|nr:response regulator transcription factor [Rivularia sp. MS3]
MRILLVEDELKIAQFITQGLTEIGYVVNHGEDGRAGRDLTDTYKYDLIILDIMLPKISGLELLKHIRSVKITTPVLLLTARDTVEDRVRGLDLGADDYLVKPFAFSELMARLRALQRRPPLQFSTILKVGDLVMDTVKREIYRGDRAIVLSPLEYNLLEYLMRNCDRALSRTQIGERIWELDFCSNSNVVDVYIGYLRRKIDKGYAQALIYTIRGVGYCLKTPSID